MSSKYRLWQVCYFLLFLPGTCAFALHFSANNPVQQQRASQNGRRDDKAIALNMCICIDCSRVTNCSAYHFVETKHEQPHMTEEPTFTPREGSPTIHVNVRTVRNADDQAAEMELMWREYKTEEAKAEEAAAADNESSSLHGEAVYDFTPVTTVEYDVVACADFVEDKGCWVRNMPEEIRAANPNFVPG